MHEFKTKKREPFVFKVDKKQFSIPNANSLSTRQIAMLASGNVDYTSSLLAELAPGLEDALTKDLIDEFIDAWIAFSDSEEVKKD